ncbi:modification methylase [Merismopedia glauca CCAP 1448/3]|uniref:Site-specific DNA-methyltransferase (adenine-specific) n=1 Tax=Merismopedia glauca CCAP 1448/3 TaxID=1296344 RepID=A0A2T1C142_9CYAN|nr:DNA adenine methylase [Merismopedia glauca]PSB01962.1 modification methylase [Merismopedia glauca CCAP 1448/3]
MNCKPFLKWAGGKSQLWDEISRRIPTDFSTYFEPFLGGGSIFFYLQPKQAYLSDVNFELINTYRVIRDNVDELITDLKTHIHQEEYFYQIRNIDRAEAYQNWNAIKRASRLIYLNKTCYNGLTRVNSKGQFNVPFGKYANPKIVDENNLIACHQALKNAEINVGSFREIEQLVTSEDFVYFDPPYAPLSETANFTSYTQDGFGEEQHRELKELCDRLTEKRVRWLLSNSSAPWILELYQDYKIEFVQANRAINSKSEKRGKVEEILVSNY